MALLYVLMLCVGRFLSEVHLGNFVPLGDYKYEPIWWVKHPIICLSLFLLSLWHFWIWSLCPCWSIRVWDLQLKYCRFNSENPQLRYCGLLSFIIISSFCNNCGWGAFIQLNIIISLLLDEDLVYRLEFVLGSICKGRLWMPDWNWTRRLSVWLCNYILRQRPGS